MREQKTATPLRAAIVAVLAFTMMLFCVGCSCSTQSSESAPAISTLSASAEPVVSNSSASSDAARTPTMPVDFAALQEQNQDVYAWIYIPGTSVNHPIVQNALLDNYYLSHNVYDEEDVLGALYTQSVNMRDFMDPVTIIYGHTFEQDGVVQDSMFGTLHYYSDATFFEEHPTMYIFMPGKVLTYEIVSAYEYDNRHILNSYDFSDGQIVQAYFDYVLNPDSMFKNVRDHAPLESGKDRIVQLSTCTHPPNDNARYLITGVLVNEQSVE